MYAIINTKTKKFVYDTDFSKKTPMQKSSSNMILLFDTKKEAEKAYKTRQCGKTYKICEINFTINQVFK